MALSPFVERTAELDVIRTALVESTRAVVISGPAGVGKSRLVREALGSRPAAMTMASPAAPVPFGLIRNLVTADESDGVHRAAEVRGYVGALRRLSGPIVVEDLHWADADSVAVLVDLVRSPGAPLLIVTTRDEPHRVLSDGLASLLSTPEVTTVRLDGLSTGGVIELMEAIWDARVPARVGLDVRRRTGGLPYWVEELTRAARTPTDLTRRGLPDVVGEALCARVDQAGAGPRQLAEAASVLGDHVTLFLLSKVLGRSEQSVRLDCELLVEAEIVVPAAAGQITFWHALTREAVESRVPRAQRRGWHKSAYEVLLAEGASVAELAWHAANAGSDGKTRETVLAGARELIAAGSGAEALRLVETLLSSGPEPGSGSGEAQAAWQVHAVAAQAAYAAAWFDEAERHVDHWRYGAAEGDAVDAVADAECLRALLRWHAGDPAGMWAALDSAVGQHGIDDRTLARVHAARSGALMRSERTEEAVAAADVALELAGRAGEDGAYRAALVDKGTAFTQLAERDGDRARRREGLDLIATAERLAVAAGDSVTLGRAINNALEPRMKDHPAPVQWAVWEETHQRAVASGLHPVLGTIARQGVTLAYDTGQWGRGWEVLTTRLPEETHPVERVVLAAHCCLMALEADRLDDAISFADRCRAEAAGKEQFWKILYVALVDVALTARTAPTALIVRALTRYRQAVAQPEHLSRPFRAWEAGRWALDAGVPAATVRAFLTATVPGGLTGSSAGEAELALAEAERDHRSAIDAGLRLLDQDLGAVRRADVLTRLGRSLLQRGRRNEALAYGAEACSLLEQWPGFRLEAAQALCKAANEPDLGLTSREREVLDLVSDGLSNREIADQLGVSVRTVAVHVSRLLGKTGSSSRTQLAVRYLRSELT